MPIASMNPPKIKYISMIRVRTSIGNHNKIAVIGPNGPRFRM